MPTPAFAPTAEDLIVMRLPLSSFEAMSGPLRAAFLAEAEDEEDPEFVDEEFDDEEDEDDEEDDDTEDDDEESEEDTEAA